MSMSMSLINGLYHREMRLQPIQRKLSERTMWNRFTPRSRAKQLIYGRLIYTKTHIIKQVSIHKLTLIAGWILVNDESDDKCSKTLDTLKANGLADGVIEFKSGKEITENYEMFDGPMEGTVGYFNPTSVQSLFMRLKAGLGKCCTSNFSHCLRSPTTRSDISFRRSRTGNFITLR
jgi:hypothetical protein